MIRTVPTSRAALAAAVLVALVATSGCGWFRKGKDLYHDDPAQRPLEVPPPMQAATETAPEAGGVTASSVASARRPATSAVGFTIPGSREEAFNRVGTLLESIDGVNITSRAQLLGVYDIDYQGSNFLVRVGDAPGGGVMVEAVDPRGVPASGEAPARLIEALQRAMQGD
ncbi:hypothetical protein [Marilutibacter alkalisoli]|uniref:Beta-barrel assembly machine subunit BamC n=1 Tax=Marilutibacter alkalisoli TaxID=2591633 RepID=A0A514BQX5_9GAMM|nr:hypothetical protein [Lysobacter alkalisoli]QDH69771.1 hypothetical protein FKV23_06425 [Lysobacter alkalisoli]